ncbi:MAG: GC-type dockerin domain-anchored protein [Phycisphaerales bacterium]|nr:GC-type dockerin domain-anchored protein [Phycisphaerales bacterium]
MRSSLTPLVTVLLAAPFAAAQLQPFELIVTVSPPGSNTNPASWQPVMRFGFADTGSVPAVLDDIPNGEVFDPAGVVFRTGTDFFIGNRHGNNAGLGSISRFTLSSNGLIATPNGNFTTPGMIGVHELAISPTTGDLYAATVDDGIFRFTFDGGGQPVFASHFANGLQTRGVLVHPNGRFIYATTHSNLIRVFHIENDNSVTTLPSVAVPGASNLHFFCLGPSGDELYVGDISSSKVFRFSMFPGGELVAKPAIDSPAAIDLAFSADGQEMFVGNHFQGGITRYAYQPGTDSWTQSGTITTPSMGGFATYVRPPCGNTDVGKQGGVRGSDGLLNNNDFVVFIDLFFEHDPRADFGSQGGVAGSDGQWDNNDFVVYIDEFFFGCF